MVPRKLLFKEQEKESIQNVKTDTFQTKLRVKKTK